MTPGQNQTNSAQEHRSKNFEIVNRHGATRIAIRIALCDTCTCGHVCKPKRYTQTRDIFQNVSKNFVQCDTRTSGGVSKNSAYTVTSVKRNTCQKHNCTACHLTPRNVSQEHCYSLPRFKMNTCLSKSFSMSKWMHITTDFYSMRRHPLDGFLEILCTVRHVWTCVATFFKTHGTGLVGRVWKWYFVQCDKCVKTYSVTRVIWKWKQYHMW